MDFDELKRILDMVREHELSEFELERDGLKIKIKKGGGLRGAGVSAEFAVPSPPAAGPAPAGTPHVPVPVPAAPSVSVAEAEEVELAVVKSPIVGTFYRAPEPNAPPFVKVGDIVKKGQVLCIVEAMKLMNEIESDHAGEIVKIFVENSQPVQYGERLFAIRTHNE
jgi:acetyl-CoA carboxylase biotin carboxyl carrier protein